MTVVLYAGFRAFGFHDAYAEGFARFSPGTLGRLARMQALFRTDHLELFDPSMDDEWYPQALHHFPDRALYATCTVGVRNIGIPIVRHLPRLRTLRHRISSARRAVSSRR